MTVVVVGGGFAGTITALWLLHEGVQDVRVIERRQCITTTPCAEGISQATLAHLMPVFDAAPHVAKTFVGIEWRFPGRRLLLDQACHTMRREEWIPAMADAVADRGGTVEVGSRFAPDNEPSAMVVGADGPASMVRELVGSRVKIVTALQRRAKAREAGERLLFQTSRLFSPEYAWWFPRGDIDNIGIIATADRQGRERLERWCHHLGVAGGRTEAYPIATGGTRFASRDGRIALIGDAAGLTNPLTKGGMAAVIHAAPILAKHARRGDLRGYHHEIKRHPVNDGSFQRVAGWLARHDDDDLRRRLRHAPEPVVVGSGVPRRVLLRTLAPRPWLAGRYVDLARAARRSVRYSW